MIYVYLGEKCGTIWNEEVKVSQRPEKREIYAQNVRLTYFPIIEVLWGNNSQSKLNFTQVTPFIDNFLLLQFYHMHKTFKRDHTASLTYHLKLVGWMIFSNSFNSFESCCKSSRKMNDKSITSHYTTHHDVYFESLVWIF